MKKKYRFNGKPVTVKFNEYRNNGTLALILVFSNGEEEVVTTNLNSPFQSKTDAYLDTNNYPGIEEFITKNKLGETTFISQQSGFCRYPLYHIFRDSL